MDGVEVLVVDGANVVGSRPDGWWRDRAGAAARLHTRLSGAAGLASQVILVLEGQARPGVPETSAADGGPPGRVVVVHAPADGDDRIVAEAGTAVAAGRSVAAVTADRALSERLRAAGAEVIGPGWLLDRLDQVG